MLLMLYHFNIINHRRSQGMHWVHVHLPQGGENIFLGQIYRGEVVSAPSERECTPEAEQESNF